MARVRRRPDAAAAEEAAVLGELAEQGARIGADADAARMLARVAGLQEAISG